MGAKVLWLRHRQHRFLIQRVKSGTCVPLDAPRGSGTAVASYFLSFSHPELSKRLHQALVNEGRRTLLGFGAFREFPLGHHGTLDVNAGPVFLGVSVGATGFGLGAAKANGNQESFLELFRTVQLFGVPTTSGSTTSFALGGELGNALLLAMLTARAS